jgi:aryl-alcohol dehydrogenase-like predicted oxidoreductase
LPDAVETMNALVKEGKVRVKGLSAYSANDFERLVPSVQPAVLQSWAHALDDQFVHLGSRVNQLLEKHGLSFVAFGPLAQGRLLDKYDPANPPQFEPGDHRQDKATFSAAELEKLKPKLEKLIERFGATTQDLAAVALSYILAQPRVACVIPGFRNERQARCNLAGAGRSLTNDDLEFIREALS